MRSLFVFSALVVVGCGSSSAVPDADVTLPVDSGAPDASVVDSGVMPQRDAGAMGSFTRTMPAWSTRAYDVRVPASADGVTALPVLIALHGGGGNRAEAKQITCPTADTASPECLDALADARGFVTVYPDGTGAPLIPSLRTWNAGGGESGWQCISGYACTQHIDDLAYFTALIADLSTLVHIDTHRVFVTGHSNGAAMAHRLACELPQNVRAIASVAGENQFAMTKPCPASPAVMEIHGNADPCWLFDGGVQSCADNNPGAKVGVGVSIDGWLQRNGCTSARTTTGVPDSEADGTTAVRYDYSCPAGHEVVLYEVMDGGHTWPGGHDRGTNGLTSRDFSANHVMLDFFAAH